MSACGGVNPVTLKELRQMVRSRLVATGLIGLLFAQVIGASLALMAASEDSLTLGQGVFGAVYFLLCVVLLLCVPLFMGTRMAFERGRENLDLQFVTALTPRQLVDGKMASATVLVLLFTSASLPFLMLSYLLRGVDLFRVLAAVAGLLVLTVVYLYGILFLAAAVTSRIMRVLLLFGVVFALLVSVGVATGFGVELVERGKGLVPGDAGEWAVLGVTLVALGGCCALLRACTVAALSPAHANRAPRVRLWFTALWLVWGVLAGVASALARDVDYLQAWAVVWVMVSAALMAVCASLAGGYSRRVLSRVSAWGPVRVVQFVWFSGSEGGVVWAFLLGFATVVGMVWADRYVPGVSRYDLESLPLVPLFLYLTAYVWTVRAVWGYLLARVVPQWLVGVAAVVCVGVGAMVPHLLAIGQDAKVDPEHCFGNLFFEWKELGAVEVQVVYAALWAAVALVACVPLVLRSFERFRGPERGSAAGAGVADGG